MTHLVTGAAGFIGYHLAKRLLDRGDEVVGIDIVNDYYDPRLKLARLDDLGVDGGSVDRAGEARGPGGEKLASARLARSATREGFRFARIGLEDRASIEALFSAQRFDRVCNLAAQAGVRYSLDNPRAYIDSNVVGFLNLLEACRAAKTPHLVYASSSSVYGLGSARPYSTRGPVDHPASLYAATKRADELMAHTYGHLFGLPTTGLRFFTVYGPWGRPDMAYFKFAEAMTAGRPIDVYNGGDMLRDFTYIDDIVEGIVRVLDSVPAPDPSWDPAAANPARSSAPFRLYNIGNHRPVRLSAFIDELERALGCEAIRRDQPMQPGDIYATEADVSELERDFGWAPSTTIAAGLERFARWFLGWKASRDRP